MMATDRAGPSTPGSTGSMADGQPGDQDHSERGNIGTRYRGNILSQIVSIPTWTGSDGDLHVELIKYHGYPVEEHVVTSEDGYMTTLQRLPYSNKSITREDRPVVLLFHGIMGSSETFLELGPNLALGFLLADAGYDVWLSNARGSGYSRNHVTLSPEQPQFWNFSFHEMGYYDLPPTIDYILALTAQSQLFYIGHSMGCSAFFIMATMRPEYNSKVRLMVALAPAVFLGEVKSPLFLVLKQFHDQIFDIMMKASLYELLPFNDITATIVPQLSSAGALKPLCTTMLQLVMGMSPQHQTKGIVPRIMAHYPAGTSINTLEHLVQLHYSGEFSEFEPQFLGKIEDFRKHHKSRPYNISLATAPVAIYYAQPDIYVVPKAVWQLVKKVPNLVHIHKIPSNTFNHADFTLSKDAKPLVYNDIIRIMKTFRKR